VSAPKFVIICVAYQMFSGDTAHLAEEHRTRDSESRIARINRARAIHDRARAI
jgi:hypothetical protein